MLLDRFRRYIPLAVWAIAVLTLLFIPARIISYGYIPDDDALRHAAKAISGKPWSEILVMRSDFPLDFHQGWHSILSWVHRAVQADTETLVVLSVVGLMILVNLAVLVQLRRPEAWLAALLAEGLAAPVIVSRLTFGRPFLFTMAVFITLLFLWSRHEDARTKPVVLLVSVVLMGAAAWIHGSAWYLLSLPAFALLLAGLWHKAIWYVGCWLVGSVLGASLTGHPWQFLGESVQLVLQAFGNNALARQLVSEFLPSSGDYGVVLVVLAMIAWRSRSAGWTARELANPIFLMALIGWTLGLKVIRFSVDWGLPAILVWLAIEFEKQFEQYLHFDSWRRLLITVGLAIGTFLLTTGDVQSRWTWNMTTQFLAAESPELAGWMPEPDGVIYSSDMQVFYFTFFRNPTAPWRYVLGFEPALMRPEDLAVMRKVVWNLGDLRAYEPWIKKLRPQDRLILRASSSHLSGPPNIPELEWRFAANDYWIGRLPRINAIPSAVHNAESQVRGPESK
jgi:hypothetical protein